MGMTPTGAYVPGTGDQIRHDYVTRFTPSSLRFDLCLHPCGQLFLICRPKTLPAIIQAWHITLREAAMLELGTSLTLTDATLLARTLNLPFPLATLPATVNNLVLTQGR